MCLQAAIYAQDGKVATGRHHGDAFSKLSVQEQEGKLTSGFLNPKTGKFITNDDSQFYLKKIILIRHAMPGEGDDPGLSDIGRSQCKRVADFLMARFHLPDYEAFSSPVRRCRETMQEIFGGMDLKLNVGALFSKRHDDEPVCEFLQRIRHVLDILPEKSIIISHCDFIVDVSQVALAMADPKTFCQVTCGDCQWNCKISCGSVTYLEHNRPVLVGITEFEKE